MSVKTEILKILEANRDKDLSGQELADLLGVSRAAVWKAVKVLKDEGYHVAAANNRGYRLEEDSDVLSEEGIYLNLDSRYQDREIHVYKSIDSTNQEVKRRALDGAGEGLVILSEEQTAGRGRRGRSFYSPQKTGIYMSVLFRPEAERSQDVVLVTTAASVAICRAIRKVLGEEPEIKWVNDVYLRGKKVCGILTEAVSDFESGRIDTVIVGIGINYRVPDEGFPEEIKDIAGPVCRIDHTVPRNTLVAAILNELYSLYEGLSERTYMADYKKWSNVIGREVRFSTGADMTKEENWEWGTAVDIDSDGGLLVQMKNGEQRTLRTGEITLRVCK
jgi:BirA family biotin operon repressor/biotin-[acetyl-CoA-carboxylase] ligase